MTVTWLAERWSLWACTGCKNGPRLEGIEEKLAEIISFLLLLKQLNNSIVASVCAFTPVSVKERSFLHHG